MKINIITSEDFKMIKLAVVGSRDFNDYELFKSCVDIYITQLGGVSEIISGGAKGADTMAERYARENNIPITILKPDWKTQGKGAGLLRNTDIIINSTHVIAFPTKTSKGTRDSIRKAKLYDKPHLIIEV